MIDQLNAKLYNPVGLNILWPRNVAFLYVCASSSIAFREFANACYRSFSLRLSTTSVSSSFQGIAADKSTFGSVFSDGPIYWCDILSCHEADFHIVYIPGCEG